MADFLTDYFGLRGRVAALTGAGGHVIGALSRGLARAGVAVAVLDVRMDDAERTVSDIVKAGGTAAAFQLDVRRKADFEQCLDSVVSTFGDVHYCVNGAGINAPTPFLDIDEAEWNNILAVQLTGTLFGMQVFGGHMLRKGYGAIVNISSASAGPPLSKAYTYSVAKAGIVNLTQNVAREWATQGVRVNAVRPGFFPTEWNRKNFITPEREAAILGHTPMRRFGDPEELVGAVLWLLSDAASFVTGAEIAVDGGYAAMTI
jgi:NAD(P)-dependent dehydrogenase (short-subunit alcohol dehydrogenase family)